MQLTLVLPNLLDAEPGTLDAAAAPSLARLLTTSAPPVTTADGAMGLACESLGIARQYDWPVAPLLASAAGIDTGKRYWLCAQPLTLALERGEGRVAGVVTDLEADESASLLGGLRAHFASDGVDFVERGAGRWWASLVEAQRLENVAARRRTRQTPRRASAARRGRRPLATMAEVRCKCSSSSIR